MIMRGPNTWAGSSGAPPALPPFSPLDWVDEPTGGVDPVTRRQFWEMIYEAAQQGVTIFVTTHYMDEAEYCDRISIMVDGRIDAMGTTQELKRRFQAATMDEVFLKLVRNN